ncbi:FMP27 C-terminal protein [Dioscorea alata]|uniref:FMP27 C-terminal protein n=1 Tax=Dioscorea alata TaxID=55571 RepID=A0ACB7ULD2_DIOAL|nr:FMP27 C-terminal protein [Dioscorea alata]
MASSPVKFFFVLLVVCAIGWVVFVFAARLLAWFLSRTTGASVGFRVAGCNCLRDVTLKFRKGALESVSIGEIKLSLRKSLVKLGFSFISRDPKLQLLISDLEIVTRPSVQGSKKGKSHKPRSSGRGKWMILSNMARFLSVSVTELTVKVPKAIIEVKDLKLDVSKSGGSSPVLNIKLYIIPLTVQISIMEKNSAPFICEDLSVACEFGHDRERGVKIRDLDVKCGDVTLNLNENLFLKNTTKSGTSDVDTSGGTFDSSVDKRSQKKKLSVLSMKNHILAFPEKVSFNMPKLDLKFLHKGQNLYIENNVMGIHFKSSKSQYEDSGETTSHLDVQMDLSEIHLLREGTTSILEILKVALIASVDVPMQPVLPIRAEIDVKLGGTQCSLIMGRLKPWLQLHNSKKKRMVLHGENVHQEQFQASEVKPIMWACTVSAPEMTIVLYNLDGMPVYHGCSQSSHLFSNNIASKGVQVHAELGELHLHMADEYQQFKENIFGVETTSSSLIHIARVSLDWGQREIESHEGYDSDKLHLVFSVDISGMDVQFGLKHVESFIFTMMSFKALLKSLSSNKRVTQNKEGRLRKTAAKGFRMLKLNLDKCSINYCGNISLDDAIVADPKRVNYGSQGGPIIISVNTDGTPRNANIISSLPDGRKQLKFFTSLDIFHLSVCVNKDKESMQMELDRARSVYEEHSEEHKPAIKVNLFDMQKGKFVRRSGGLNDIAVCSYFSATDISVRWEPDAHLALFEFVTRLRFMLHNQKRQISTNEISKDPFDIRDHELGKVIVMDESQPEKQCRKRESVFAVDVEMLRVSAELADGVEGMVHVQSIFSENAKIGVLLEGLMLSFNGSRIFKSSRMQVSRIPLPTTNPGDTKVLSATSWDWVIQGLDVHICMPYRLQLRAVDDAVEDTLRALKLITKSISSVLFPVKMDNSKKGKSKSTKSESVRFIIRKLTADIEEEPIQGWLDEHYQLLKNEICEQAVRLRLLDEMISSHSNDIGNVESNELPSEKKLNFDGIEIDVLDASAIQRLKEEIYKKTFRSYYEACQKLVFSEGSGACSSGFQSGFRTSTNRSSLLSVCATELDVSLTKIKGGDVGMVEFIRKSDPIALENEIPFSRLYGRDISVNAGYLAVRLRNYTFPLFAATSGKCKGCVVLAQQATCFQPQIVQDVYVGRWRKVQLLRSASGTTPPMKTYSDLPICFQKGEVSFGVGYEPVFADVSYAFTVALRRANLSIRIPDSGLNNQNVLGSQQPTILLGGQPPKKERSLPWWDDMRNYIHGKNCLCFRESTWNLLATTNPYEKLDKLQILSGYMDIQQTDGRVFLSAKEFKIYVSSLESLSNNCSLKLPRKTCIPFIDSPAFSLEVVMNWECESGNPLNHYLYALPNEGGPRQKVFDPFRSTSLSLRWNFSLRPLPLGEKDLKSAIEDNAMLDGTIYCSSQKMESSLSDFPTLTFGAHDLAWIFKWWNMMYNPPHKLRSFSRWPRFRVPRIPRSGNLSLDRVMTENFLRVDSTPTCVKHMPLGDDDPASGLTFKMTKLKYELCYSRGKQKYTFESKRDSLDLVYQGLDLHMLKAYLNRDSSKTVQDIQTAKHSLQNVPADKVSNEKNSYLSSCTEKNQDDGFLLYSDYFTIRRQTPKADPSRLLAWQEAGRKNLEMTYVRSEFENGSESDHARSSDDDGFNVVIADNCQRVFVYGLKLLWTIENRDAVWSWVGGISKAFEPSKPSPSRQYAQRKLVEGSVPEGSEMPHDDTIKSSPSISQSASFSSPKHAEVSSQLPSSSSSTKIDVSHSPMKLGHVDDSEDDGIRHFMVNVLQPQFNLHSEDANGRFLLAAASGRVLARSFHSVLHVGYEMIEQALGTESVHIPEVEPEMTWKRVELSVMLEHVQAHVAPTDVDPGAGLQWLPKILRSSPKVKRTGALLERVFLPCQMYFRYTRHKGGTADLKVKPLKELNFNSPNITATMTSRQFQVMLDVLSNLLFARLPKPRKSSLSYPSEDDDDVEEEADEVVPDGVEEVELAKISLEQRERERKLLLDDIRNLLATNNITGDPCLMPEKDEDIWMITGGKSMLVQGLKKELGNIQKSRKAASTALRMALQKAAQLRLMEKEKNKSPSYAMRISMRINKVVWSMLADGKTFAEAEIKDMIYDFDRDYKDIGIAQFTTKSFVVRNCLQNAKSDMLLSAWNAPPEWGKNVMLRVDAKQGAPKDGSSPLELFHVEIYPLKIHLAETMYRMMWDYFFPEEEQDSQRRQEVWKVSTTASSRRGRKGSAAEPSSSSSHAIRELEALGKLGTAASSSVPGGAIQFSTSGDSSQGSKKPNTRPNSELRRTSSFDRTWEENVAESVANELVMQVHSSSISTKSGLLNPTPELQNASVEVASKSKPKDKMAKAARLSHEEKKVGKSQDEKRTRARKMMEFHNIKISQVELLVTYEGSRFAVNDLRLLMDTFHRVEFTGTWRRLFSRVKKHIIWGVLKSVTGMQGKKFKDKAQSQRDAQGVVPDIDLNFSDSDGGQPGKADQNPIAFLKRPSDGAGDGFVTSIKGLFNSQRRKAKAFVLKTMRGEADNEYHGEWSESDVEFSPFARQLTITKAKKLIRRHTKKFRSRGQKVQQIDSLQSSPRETTPYQSDSSGGSSYEDFHEMKAAVLD